MNEAAETLAQRLPDDGSGFEHAPANAVSGGMLLRRAREAAGLQVAALAGVLKVPVYKLEALEGDRFDLLTDLVFARALAGSVCRTLKIDPQPVMDRLPQTTAPRLAQNRDGINASFRGSDQFAQSSWLAHLSKPVVLVVFALLLGALVLIFLPSAGQDPELAASGPTGVSAPVSASAESGRAVTRQSAIDLVVPPLVATDSLARPVAGAVLIGPSVSVAASASTPSSAVLATVARSVTSVASPTAVITPSPVLTRAVALSSASAAAAPAPAASGLLVFRSAASSWVQVTDAKGVVVLRQTLGAGESASASGPTPLRVTIGSASSTAVQVRGKPFDLAPVSRDNVARFEVK